MSAPRKIVAIDATAVLTLSTDGYPMEHVGAAMAILCWHARGHAPNDEAHRRIAGLGRARWRRESDAIMGAVRRLTDASEVRAQFSRPTVSAARRAAILERDGAVCLYCGDTDGPFHIDHMTPLARGGSNRDENLCVACAPCNLRKAAKVGSEWNY